MRIRNLFLIFIGLLIILGCDSSLTSWLPWTSSIAGTKWTSGPIGKDIAFKDGQTIEFFSDNTFSHRVFFQTMKGTWTKLNDGDIKMEYADPANPYFIIAKIEGDQLKITNQFGSGYLNRVK